MRETKTLILHIEVTNESVASAEERETSLTRKKSQVQIL
jgi:hypothetical protein